MKLEPPFTKYLEGDRPTHCLARDLAKHIPAWTSSEISKMLLSSGYLSKEGKLTAQAFENGIVDLCENKGLWNLSETKKALIAVYKMDKHGKDGVAQRERSEPAWVDLGTIGTYFGVSNIVVGKWLDLLGFREVPQKQVNSSGDYDMLDFAFEAKEKQINGFIIKQPTEKALNGGVARKITVTKNHKEIDIVHWNLDLCKAIFVKVGHELDIERKMTLKGKGKNGNVKIITMDDRVQELYDKWKPLHANPETRNKSWEIFEKQPKPILLKLEILLNKPGYLTEKQYLKDRY